MRICITTLEIVPPVGGTGERIWSIAQELSRMELEVTLYAPLRCSEASDTVKLCKLPHSRSDIADAIRLLLSLFKLEVSDVLQIEIRDPIKTLLLYCLLSPLARKVVVVLHDKCWQQDPRRISIRGKIKYLIQRMIFDLCQLIVVPSDELREWYILLHGRKYLGKLAVIPNGAPNLRLRTYSKENIREKFGIPAGDFVALFFGYLGFEPNKIAALWIYEAADNAARLFKELTGRNLLFVISGIGSEIFPRTAHVLPLGFTENIMDPLSAADACIFPHGPSFSGPHIKTIYAFAAAKAVVTTPDGVKGMKDVVERVHYLAFNMNDVSAVSKVLAELALDSDLRERIQSNAQAYARSYTWRHVAESYLEYYAKLLN